MKRNGKRSGIGSHGKGEEQARAEGGGFEGLVPHRDWRESPRGGRGARDPGFVGLGGANFDGEEVRHLGGHAYVDREAVGRNDTWMEFVVHEILHARGNSGHLEENACPDAVLSASPKGNLSDVPRLWLTVEGEAMLPEIAWIPGVQHVDVPAADLGSWEDDGFQFLGQSGLGRPGVADMRFRATRRNGLGRPWARETHPGGPGSGLRCGDGDLGHTIGVRTEPATEVFVSTFAAGDEPGIVTGTFVGAGGRRRRR